MVEGCHFPRFEKSPQLDRLIEFEQGMVYVLCVPYRKPQRQTIAGMNLQSVAAGWLVRHWDIVHTI